MFKKVVQTLTAGGILLEPGLTYKELRMVEKIYNINFPKSFRKFLRGCLPVSKGFYNWRDFSDENVAKIKAVMARPGEAVFESVRDIYWCDAWGEKPNTDEETIQRILEKLEDAPKLIPIYGHRYMPAEGKNPPVLSVYDLDMIYYGKDLYDYFMVEFGGKKQQSIEFKSIPEVTFWSDIM